MPKDTEGTVNYHDGLLLRKALRGEIPPDQQADLRAAVPAYLRDALRAIIRRGREGDVDALNWLIENIGLPAPAVQKTEDWPD